MVSNLLLQFSFLALLSTVSCAVQNLQLNNIADSMNLPQIRVQWTDTGQPSNYTVQIYREKSMFVNTAVLIKKDITTVKEVTFGSLEFGATYRVDVFEHDTNGALTNSLSKIKKTDLTPKPLITSNVAQILMAYPAISGIEYYRLLVLKVTDDNQLKSSPLASKSYVAYQVDSNSVGRSFEIFDLGKNQTSGVGNIFRNKPLDAGSKYAFTQVFRINSTDFFFPWSDTITAPGPVPKDKDDLTSAEIVGIIVGVTAAIIGVVFIIICCLNWKYSLRYKPAPAKGKPANPIQRLVTDPAIPVTEDDFFDHVTQMKLHNFKGFYEEFSSKKAEFQNSEAFRHPDNQSKNRYLNIPCFDDSRVKLEGGDDDVENYIHANYVPGAFNDKEYIYTQSPLPETVSDFWAMIWQQDCSNIVMIGELVEKGKQECAPYFPVKVDETLESYCLVTLCHIHVTTYYTVRTLVLSKEKEEKRIKHYQYNGWPTNKLTPEYPTSFLQMVLRISNELPDRPAAPIAVHGTNDRYGRAGIYICIDAEIQRFKKQGDLSVFGSVMTCKNYRHEGVKTLDEYIFIHDTVLEAVLLKSIKNISVASLPKYIENASKGNKGLFDTEFNFLTSTTMASTQKMAAASQACNIPKNRYANVKPYDYNRVKLKKLMNEEGSDYINASYIDTYNTKKAFIVTQAPLVETIADFWRMINENESWVIIMLGQEIENGQLKANRFWPEEGLVMSLEDVTIKFISISRDAIPDVWIRQMELLNGKGERKLIQFYQYHSWPSHQQITSQSIRSLVQLAHQSNSWKDKLGAQRITVVSSAGIGRPGVLCGLSSLQEEADNEGYVNVFQTVQKLNQQRPSIVQSREEYALMYTSTLQLTENARRKNVIKEMSLDDCCDDGTFLGIDLDKGGQPVCSDPSAEGPAKEVETPVDDPVVEPVEKIPHVAFQVDTDNEKPISRVNSGTHDSQM